MDPHQPSHLTFLWNKTNTLNPLCLPLFGASSSPQFFLTILYLNPCGFAGLFNTDLTPGWCEAPAWVATPQFPSHQCLDTSSQHRHLTISLQSWISPYCYCSEQFSTYSSDLCTFPDDIVWRSLKLINSNFFVIITCEDNVYNTVNMYQ